MPSAPYLGLTGTTLPRAVHQPLELLADLAIPTVLLAFGIALVTQTGGTGKDSRVDLWLAVVLKVLLMPALAYVLARWAFGLSPEQTAIVTVLAALPAAQNLNTYASVFERGEKLARDATLITTLASVPVIAGIAYLLGLSNVQRVPQPNSSSVRAGLTGPATECAGLPTCRVQHTHAPREGTSWTARMPGTNPLAGQLGGGKAERHRWHPVAGRRRSPPRRASREPRRRQIEHHLTAGEPWAHSVISPIASVGSGTSAGPRR